MSKEIVFEITVDGKFLRHCNRLSIHQSFNAHHTFELAVDQDVFEKLGSYGMEGSQKFIGTNLTICFGQNNTSDNIFKGIITEVVLLHGNGAWGTLLFKGYSPTCLMESGADYASYEDITLKGLLDESLKAMVETDMSIVNNPLATDIIPYMCQYAESNFSFINRLSVQYGEWFLHDGSTLYFGKPSSLKNIEMIYGQHISSMNVSMKIVPSAIEHYSYQYKDDSTLTTLLPQQLDQVNSYTEKALEVSSKLYITLVKQPAEIQIRDMNGMDLHARKHKARLASSAVIMTAEGDNPKILLGNLITVKIAKKNGEGYDVHGEYIVTKLTHSLTGNGKYSNSFEAIPSSNDVVPASAVKLIAETQLAKVTDNNDPEGLGRVRVQMLWQQETSQKTDWIRVLTNDAGGTGEVRKNRGQVFIPEVNDQVLIGFQYNDPNHPYVQGSLFHGNTAAGGSTDNSIKSIKTRSGHALEFNDTRDGESITIKDKNGNAIVLDTAGKNITITAPETMTFNTKNMVMNIDENMTIEIGKDMKTSIGANNKLTIAENYEINSNKTQEHIEVDKKLTIGGDLDVSTASVKMNATAGDVSIKSSALATLHGISDAKVNKG